MGKRSNGEGCYGKVKKGKYLYYYYKDVNGKFTYAKTQKELKEKIKNKKDSKLVVSQKTTFGNYITDWLKMKEGTVEITTYQGYEELISYLIINYDGYDLKNKQLGSLSPKVFQAYLNSLAKKYAKETIRKVWILIKQCIKYGEIQKEIKPNTIAMVKIPNESYIAKQKREIEFLDIKQADILYNMLEYRDKKNMRRYKNSSNAHLIILLLYSGMRIGEAIALKWKNVDIENKTIKIEESSAEIKTENGRISIDKVAKTKSSIRIIPLPNRAMEMIDFFDKLNKKHNPNDYVCISRDKTKIISRNVRRTLDSMAKDAGLPHITPHGLRHSYGYILLSQGVDIKTISELLGHKNITITYNIYIGVKEEDKRNAVDKAFDI